MVETIKKEYKIIDFYNFHPKKDALPTLQECPLGIWSSSGAGSREALSPDQCDIFCRLITK